MTLAILQRAVEALEHADVTLTSADAADLDPIVGSDNPHEHAAGLVRAVLAELKAEIARVEALPPVYDDHLLNMVRKGYGEPRKP